MTLLQVACVITLLEKYLCHKHMILVKKDDGRSPSPTNDSALLFVSTIL